MLSHFEHIGIVTTIEGQIRDANKAQERHLGNSRETDQSDEYKRGQSMLCHYHKGIADGLLMALDNVRKLTHE